MRISQNARLFRELYKNTSCVAEYQFNFALKFGHEIDEKK